MTLKFVTDVRDHEYEVIEFHGELDISTLTQTEQQMNELLEHYHRPYLVFDLRYLKFVNSEGIGFLVATHLKMLKKNQKLILFGAQSQVQEIFELLGFSKLIPVLKNFEEVIHFIKKIKS